MYEDCEECGGSGRVEAWCESCAGTGSSRSYIDAACYWCNGRGDAEPRPCESCASRMRIEALRARIMREELIFGPKLEERLKMELDALAERRVEQASRWNVGGDI